VRTLSDATKVRVVDVASSFRFSTNSRVRTSELIEEYFRPSCDVPFSISDILISKYRLLQLSHCWGAPLDVVAQTVETMFR